MIGLTGLIDTLLAEKLSQRMDLLRFTPSTVVKEPGPTPRAEAVRNDVRLPSHAALDRQMFRAADAAQPVLRAPDPSQWLSSAGRAISAILAELPADGGPVQARAALLPSPPEEGEVPALARGLAASLATSGLFYESHLLAFHRGLLPGAELALEPKARWGPAGGNATMYQDGEPASGPANGEARSMALDLPHPPAHTLLRQQLELLATGVFRWSGEAWPAVPLEWSVHEDEQGAGSNAQTAEDAAPAWTTTLALTLPRLGAVDVHLGIRGTSVSARVVAGRDSALWLRAGAGDLKARLASAGLNMPELAIQPGEQP